MAHSRLCSIPGCDKPVRVKSRGWCNAHWTRWSKYGDPLAGGPARGAITQWLEAHRGHQGSECLIWPFARSSNGYAMAWHEGSLIGGHRLMCIMAHGEPLVPSDEAAHSCNNGHLGCVNPNHLRWASRASNEHDKEVHGTDNKGERHGMARLTEAEVREIRALVATMKQRDIAAMFNVAPQTINQIVNRRSWSWLT